MPAGCLDSKGCELTVTYVTDKDSGDVTFEMSGSIGGGANSYLAVGLAPTEKMNDANVMFCYNFADKNGVAMSWNAPEEKTSTILEDPTIGIKDEARKEILHFMKL
jgi:hypothetical protein